ncbi:MAG: GNAT family N-acetyltransferase, partial [Anaerolineae bacterium]|nr:GNAT family N-acetyltransferase [Anaerolineae bacterium]
SGRTILTEYESKEVLRAYHIPITPMKIAEDTESADDAVAYAEEMGYPVVLKLNSRTVTHKTDVGGVQLNLKDADAVRAAWKRIKEGVTEAHSADDFNGVSVQPMVDLSEAYELIIGSSIDPQFGPVILFGAGGTLVEVNKDRALALPPLSTILARRAMERTKIFTALKGIRGRKSVDLAALDHLMVRFSQLIIEQPWIAECDINPLLASSDQILALDGRVVLHPQEMEGKLPRTAIRPYPKQYEDVWTSPQGMDFWLRPIRPEDEPLIVKFHEGLSERTVKLRYFTPMKLRQRISHERLTRVVFIDYDREIAIVASHTDERTGEPEIAGVGRITRTTLNSKDAEFGVIVSDRYQRQGLGRELLERLVEIGRKEGLLTITGYVLPENTEMLALAERFGFKLQDAEDGVIAAVLEL